MPNVRCPACYQASLVIIVEYDGGLQCEKCGELLQVSIRQGIVAHVSSAPNSGPDVAGLPADLQRVYDEARRCLAVKAYTAVELLSRAILMHVAVAKGAPVAQSFIEYVNYLERTGYVAPQMRPWVDLIRRHGNSATHDVTAPDIQRAEHTFLFVVNLLKLTYEMAHLAGQYHSDSDAVG